jgi:hypothetical protein
MFLSSFDISLYNSAHPPPVWLSLVCAAAAPGRVVQPSCQVTDLVVPTDCTHCPAGTEPAVGFEYKWWNTLPTNMETTVLSGINFEYKGLTGDVSPFTMSCHPLQCHSSSPKFTFFLVGPGFEFRAFALAKQVLYCLSHIFCPFLLWLFWR